VDQRPGGLDPVSVTLHWNALIAITDEATATLLRTAFSRVVTDAWDFSCALFDARGEMIAQPRQGLPAFLGCLAQSIRHFLAAYPPEALEPGDSLMTNDPPLGTSQINDITFVTPIFHRGRVVAYAANVSHSPDAGGRLLSGDAREIFEEGVRIPVVKAFSRGRRNDDLFRILRLNVRVPDIVEGDILAQLAANAVMARRVQEFLDARGLDGLEAVADAILARSEQAMRRAIAAIPDGVYAGEVQTDGFDRPLTLRATITVRGEAVAVDYAGTSPQDERGINCLPNYAFAETCFPLICIARPASPVNGATLRPIRVTAPEGSCLNPRPPAALGARAMVSMFLQCLIFRALAPAMPDRVLADCGSPPWMPTFSGRSRTGRPCVDILLLNGGLGARPGKDGISPLGWPASLSGTPVEVSECERPMFVLRRELVPDSGGAGRFRGGLGQAFVWRNDGDGPITFATRGDRVNHPPLGLFGGLPGGAARARLNGAPIHSKTTVVVRPGDVVHLQSAGGGGYGDPADRAAEAVLDDVLDGYLSPERARTDYRVAFDGAGKGIDREGTRRLREGGGAWRS
jgi:N-methylhydantoinase B